MEYRVHWLYFIRGVLLLLVLVVFIVHLNPSIELWLRGEMVSGFQTFNEFVTDRHVKIPPQKITMKKFYELYPRLASSSSSSP